MTIDELRSQIDAIDEQVLQFLSERARLAVKIGHLKESGGRPPFVPAREIHLLERLEKLNRGPLAPTALRAIYREIVAACRNLERPVSIAYLGPQATWSHLAAQQQFGETALYEPVRTIGDVFAAVETSRQDFGVVPVENSTAGSVGDTLDCFGQTTLTITAEILYQIHFALLSKETGLQEIKRIYSLPIAAEQCQRWLNVHLPHADIIDVDSTARAAQMAANEAQSAALASRMAGEQNHLNVLFERIEDSGHNSTRFFVLGHHGSEPSGRDKTSLLFAVPHRSGSLNAALQALENHGINLTMINSRPTKRMPWEYLFYVDMHGHAQDPRIKEALESMRERCAFLKILGSYPEAPGIVNL